MEEMEEFEVKPDVSEEMLKERRAAVVYLLGGVFLTVMTIGVRFRAVGIFLAGLAIAYGFGALMSKGREDKKRGLVMLGAGVIGFLAMFGPGLSKSFAMLFLWMGAVGLLASGIWSGVMFLILKRKK